MKRGKKSIIFDICFIKIIISMDVLCTQAWSLGSAVGILELNPNMQKNPAIDHIGT